MATALRFLGFWILAAGVGVYESGFLTFRNPELNLLSSAQAILQGTANSDIASYLTFALELVRTHDFATWSSLIFAPGFPLYIAAVLQLWGSDAIALHLVVLSIFLWALVLTFAYETLKRPANPIARFTCVAGLFAFSAMRTLTLGGGVVLSESVSMAFLTLSVLFLIRGLAGERRNFFWATGCLAVTANFKGLYDVIGSALLLGTFIVTSVRAGFLKVRRLPTDRAWILSAQCLALFTLLTCPWKLHNLKTHGEYVMAGYARFTAHFYYWNPNYSVEVPYLFTADAPCRVDPVQCREIQKNAATLSSTEKQRRAFAAFFRHPWTWIRYKLQYVDHLWFGVALPETIQRPWYALEQVGYLFFAFAGLVLLLQSRRSSAVWFSVWMFALFVLHAGVFCFSGYEWRYAIPLKLLCLLFPWAVLSLRETPLNSLR